MPVRRQMFSVVCRKAFALASSVDIVELFMLCYPSWFVIRWRLQVQERVLLHIGLIFRRSFFFVRPLLSIAFRLISRRYTAKQAASRTLSRISHGEPADTRDDVVFSTAAMRSRTWLSAGSAVHISGKTAAAAEAAVAGGPTTTLLARWNARNIREQSVHQCCAPLNRNVWTTRTGHEPTLGGFVQMTNR